MKTQEKVLLNEIGESPFLAEKTNPFPKKGLVLLKALFEFYSDDEYKTASLLKVYWAFVLSKQISSRLANGMREGSIDFRITSIYKDLASIKNIMRLETIKRIEKDCSENVDFDLPELYFRFKFCSRSEYAEGPSDFPVAWEGKVGYVEKVTNTLLEKLVSKIGKSRKIRRNTKQIWYTRLMEFYNHSSEIYKMLESKVTLKELKSYVVINERNLIENKKPFLKRERDLY